VALLFADEDFPYPVVQHLRDLGHDVVTTREAGLAGVGTEDPAILAAAVKLGRAVVTMNRRHYIALHGQSPVHAGIIVCKYDDNVAALARRIDSAIAAELDLNGRLLRINRPHPTQVP